MKKIAILFFGLFTAVAQAEPKEMTIWAVNDMHAAIEKFPRFSAMLNDVRKDHPEMLLFSGGDNRTGNPINDMDPNPSRPMVRLMNEMKFDASAIGNHEFDGGIDALRTVLKNSKFNYLCANMKSAGELALPVLPYKFFKKNGLKIGVLGFVQVNSRGIPDCGPDRCKGIEFRPIEKVLPEYKWMRAQCDVLILLTHNGYEDDIKLAKAFPEADVIIGGHSHTAIEGTKLHDGVMITQAERWLKYVTEIKLKVEDGKVISKNARLISVDNYPKKDEKIEKLLEELNDNPVLKRVLTKAETEFSCKEELGNLMADAIRFENKADIAIQNAGGVRIEKLAKGNVTVNDVYRMDPFGNEVVEYTLSGQEVVSLLKAASHTDDYGAAYVSGITYTISGFDKEGVKDEDIHVEVKNLDGSKFDLDKKYKVVMNSYLSSVCSFKKEDQGKNLFVACSDYLIKFLEKQSSLNYNGTKRVTILKK